MRIAFVPAVMALTLASALAALPPIYEPARLTPPQPRREFRGVWIATVANIDWPSKPGLSTAVQKAELAALINRAAQMKLNAIILQVRPACDALYESSLEPWSEYLTGTMGKAPEPFYDPLAFAVEQAHLRGMELHAWFNPYRALHPSHLGSIAPNHISRTHPELVRKIVSQEKSLLWLDPGERDVPDYTLNVMLDVVRRYDIDGVQIDDYFYPDQDGGKAAPDFPDAASWKKYGANGKLNRGDWRRENVNAFIQRTYQAIKFVKPWVKFGISPFGIWSPGHPPQIKGTDDFLVHYADSRKWLANGWLDYFSPQLYWRIAPKETSFPVLLEWWAEQNAKGRHIWPGIAAYQAERWEPTEIPSQIHFTRNERGVTGYILYKMTSVTNGFLSRALEHSINSEPALVPASPWLGPPPAKPILTVTNGSVSSALKASWQDPASESLVRYWMLQTKSNGVWSTSFLPAGRSFEIFRETPPEAIAITAIDRAGNLSAPAVVVARPRPDPKSPDRKRSPKKYSTPKDEGR